MNTMRFDALAKTLAAGSSRRTVLRGLVVGAAVGGAGLSRSALAVAQHCPAQNAQLCGNAGGTFDAGAGTCTVVGSQSCAGRNGFTRTTTTTTVYSGSGSNCQRDVQSSTTCTNKKGRAVKPTNRNCACA